MKKSRRTLKIKIPDYNINDFPIDKIQFDPFWEPLLQNENSKRSKRIE
jgi:hypothetical protein